MKAGRRVTLSAVVVGCGLVTANAQPIDNATTGSAPGLPVSAPALPPVPAVPPPAVPTRSDAAAVASTTASLPPPAALPGSTVTALSGAAGSTSNLVRPDFVRAIWVDGQGPALRSPEGIKKLVADCRDAGFDTIYAQVRANGDALYATNLAPTAAGLSSGYDGLKMLIEEAKNSSKPLHVHALLVTYRVWSAVAEAPAEHVTKQHPDWCSLAEDGSKSMENNETWLDPGVTAVQDHLALIATDLVKNYAVEGVQLDRIRYPELDLKKNPNGKLATGYSQAAIDRYNQEKSKTGRPKPMDPDWVAWRRDQVTETVRKIRDAVKAIRPAAIVSAGAITFGAPPQSREEYVSNSTPYSGVLEDWVGWCEKGLIDTNVLMNFKAVDRGLQADFEGWEDFALANKGKAKVVIGIGGFLNDPRYTAAQMLLPIFQPKADGVALYGYNDSYKETAYDRDLSFLKPVLDGAAVGTKAAEIAAAVAKPLARGVPVSEQLAKLDSAAAAAGISAPVNQVVAAATPAVSVVASAPLPQLGVASSAPKANIPALSAASSNLPGSSVAAGMPSLPGTGSSAAPSGAGGLPSLGAAAAGSAATAGSLPSLPGTSAAPMAGMPSLPSAPPTTSMPPSLANVGTAPANAGGPSLPSLPVDGGTGAMPSLPASGSSAKSNLPALTEVVPGASAGSAIPPLSTIGGSSPAVTSMPSLPITDTTIASAPALPSLSSPALPSLGEGSSVAIPSLTPEANKVVPQATNLLSPIAPLNPIATPVPGVAVEVPSFPGTVVPQSANASVTIEPPLGTPVTSIAPIPGGPATTTLSIPGTSAKTSVNIPSLGGSTNFDGMPIAAPAPASPLITPPTVLTPAPGHTNESQPVNVGKQTVMDAPVVQRMDYSERQSAYGTPNPANEIRNFTTANIRKERHDLVAMPPSPAPLEVIVLKTGKEFAGRVLQRGTVWRIELPNGSIMNIPGEKIANTRATESAPMSAGATPVPL